MMKNDSPCTGKTLPKLVKPAIMKAISVRPMHGYEILKALESNGIFTPGSVNLSGVYRTLNQLEKDGKLVSELEKPQAGPARRVYSLTEKGACCLGSWKRTLNSYKEQIETALSFLNS